jgi:hypothetical protein
VATYTRERLNEDNTQEIAGTVIADAVRLETAALPGEIVVDPATISSLPDEIRQLYGPEILVSGKRDERFPARRYAVNSEVSAPSFTDILDKARPSGPLVDRPQVVRGRVLDAAIPSHAGMDERP